MDRYKFISLGYMRWISLLIFTVWFCLTPVVIHADVPKSQKELVRRLTNKLLVNVKPNPKYQWPPVITVQDDDSSNADTYIKTLTPNTKSAPYIYVNRGLVKAVGTNIDCLAFFIAHEIGHIVLGHTLPNQNQQNDTKILEMLNSRNNETAADMEGMRILLAAGYSKREVRRGIVTCFIDKGKEYSTFSALHMDHPSWSDRMQVIDREDASLWSAMSAFRNGTSFLDAQQYELAARCFRKVTDEFDKCPEAHANLGYSLLMQYCDTLELKDIRRYDIGQILCGSFFTTPISLNNIARGAEKSIWYQAAEALTYARKLKPHDPVILANLGIAYYVHPEQRDLMNANQYFKDAIAELKTSNLDPLTKATIFINASAGLAAIGDRVKCMYCILQAQRILNSIHEHAITESLTAACLYNQANLMTNSLDIEERHKAISLWQDALKKISVSSLWWQLGYDKYATLVENLNRLYNKQKYGKLPKKSLAVMNYPFRITLNIDINPRVTISLTDTIDSVYEKLGPASPISVVPKTFINTIRYDKYGIEFLCDKRVVGIRLYNNQSPSIFIRRSGLGSKLFSISIGMPKSKVTQLLGSNSDFCNWINFSKDYEYYRDSGIAITYKNGVINEILIEQTPQGSYFGE